jgi:hypothetical protein
MSNRGVNFGVETRRDIVLMCNPVELGTWVHALFELIDFNSRDIDRTVYLYPHEMRLAPQFPGRPVHEIKAIQLGDIYEEYVRPTDYEATERRILAHMSDIDKILSGHFHALDIGLDDLVAEVKRAQLMALPREPHRTYDWRQRLPSRRRRRK